MAISSIYAKNAVDSVEKYFDSFDQPMAHLKKSRTWLTFPFRPKKNVNERVMLVLVKNIGNDWRKLAENIGFNKKQIEHYQNQFDEVKRNITSSPLSYNCDVDSQCRKYLPIMSAFILEATRKVPIDSIIFAASSCNESLARAMKHYNTTQSPLEYQITSTSAKPKYQSYIFLQWVKHKSRKPNWGHVIPNTENLPHQQNVYQWAKLNPDKLIILWFDSEPLDSNEHGQYQSFKTELESHISNTLVLDIRKVSWSSQQWRYTQHKTGTAQVETTQESLDSFNYINCSGDIDRSYMGEFVDLTRHRLLYEGEHAIRSALHNSNLPADHIEPIPNKGVYLDMDYTPISFDSTHLYSTHLCFDDAGKAITSCYSSVYCRLEQGWKSRFINSLIAVSHSHSSLLGSEFPTMNKKSDLPTYYGFNLLRDLYPYDISGVSGFTMKHETYIKGILTFQSCVEHVNRTWKYPNSVSENQDTNLAVNW